MYTPDLKDLTNDELQDRQTLLISRLNMLSSSYGSSHAMAMSQCNIWIDEIREEMYRRVALHEDNDEKSGIVYDSSDPIETRMKDK